MSKHPSDPNLVLNVQKVTQVEKLELEQSENIQLPEIEGQELQPSSNFLCDDICYLNCETHQHKCRLSVGRICVFAASVSMKWCQSFLCCWTFPCCWGWHCCRHVYLLQNNRTEPTIGCVCCRGKILCHCDKIMHVSADSCAHKCQIYQTNACSCAQRESQPCPCAAIYSNLYLFAPQTQEMIDY